MKHVILMADVIKSREEDPKLLMEDFKLLVNEANKKYKKWILSPLTITLGDEFQGILKNVKAAISIIIHFEEAIISKQLHFKLRYIVNQGEIYTPINTKIAYEMLGEGLTNAREQLGILKESKSRFLTILNNQKLSVVLNASFVVYQSIIDDWDSKRDYTLVTTFLQHNDYKKVAEIVHKNRSQIWKRHINLKIDVYLATKKIIESVINL
jgi:SatD family (SatD)